MRWKAGLLSFMAACSASSTGPVKGADTDASGAADDSGTPADTDLVPDTFADTGIAPSDSDTAPDTDVPIDTSPGSICTLPDPDEPNGRPGQAVNTALTPGGTFTRPAALIDGSADERDIYRVDVPDGCYVVATSAFDGTLVDIDLELANSTGQILDRSVGVTGEERVAWINRSGGSERVFLDVTNLDQRCITYELAIDMDCPVDTAWTDTVAGDTFDTFWGPQPATPCARPDPDEPNESSADAISTGLTAGGQTYPRTGVQLDGVTDVEDWYSLTIPAGCVAVGVITFNPSLGDVDLELLDDGLNTLDDSLGVSSTERIAWQNTGASPVSAFLRVYDLDNQCMTYDLDLKIECPTDTAWTDTYVDDDTWGWLNDTGVACTGPDPAEPNGTRPVAVATGIVGDGGTYTTADVPIDGVDDLEDLYALQLPSGCYLEAVLDSDPATADLDFVFVDARNGTLAGHTGDDASERLAWRNAGADRALYVVVYSNDNVCTEYDLSLEVTCPTDTAWADTADTPDGYVKTGCATPGPDEPNNRIADATRLTPAPGGAPAVRTDAPIDGVDDRNDLYVVEVPAGCHVVATTTFEHDDGDLDLELVTSFGGLFDGSYGVGDQERARWPNRLGAPTDVYVRVLSYETVEGCTTYDLSVTLDCPNDTAVWTDTADGGSFPVSESCATPDANEPNDAVGDATPTGLVGASAPYAQTAVPADAAHSDLDRYAASVPDGCVVRASVTSTTGNVDLELHDAAGGALEGVYGTARTETLRWQNTSGGDATVQVAAFGRGLTCSVYDLEVEITCPTAGWTDTGASTPPDSFYP